MQSSSSEVMSPVGEPILSDWFASMEDGMNLGVNAHNKFEIISPAPLRFVVEPDLMDVTDGNSTVGKKRRATNELAWMPC